MSLLAAVAAGLDTLADSLKRATGAVPQPGAPKPATGAAAAVDLDRLLGQQHDRAANPELKRIIREVAGLKR